MPSKGQKSTTFFLGHVIMVSAWCLSFLTVWFRILSFHQWATRPSPETQGNHEITSMESEWKQKLRWLPCFWIANGRVVFIAINTQWGSGTLQTKREWKDCESNSNRQNIVSWCSIPLLVLRTLKYCFWTSPAIMAHRRAGRQDTERSNSTITIHE